MSDLFQFENPWMLPAAAVLIIALAFAIFRYIRSRSGDLEHVLTEISYDRVNALIIPSADEGEILIDYLLLTSQGLLILEVKDVRGTVFGGDKLQDWTVISDERRYTFSNPIPALLDRIAAVRQIVREVPVNGRIVFPDYAEFTKGAPDLVSNLEQLKTDFGESDKKAAAFKIEAFKPHWDLIRKAALSTQTA